jgi:cupin fold WbuC family metalloprotein
VILFDEYGAITARHRLGEHSPQGRIWGVDLAAGIWHTIVARSARVICFEVKPGPWDPANDKDFAVWAPSENDPAATAYLQGLIGSG